MHLVERDRKETSHEQGREISIPINSHLRGSAARITARRERKMERSARAEASIFGKLRGIGKWSISFSKLSKLSFCRRAGGFKCDHCLGMTLGNERRCEDRLRQGSRVITKVVDAGSSFPPSNLQRTLSRLPVSSFSLPVFSPSVFPPRARQRKLDPRVGDKARSKHPG